MAENEDGQEKSQEPTAKRLQEARRKGQIARSRELTTMAVSLLGTLALIVLGKHFMRGIDEVFSLNFALAREELFDPAAVLRHLTYALRATVSMLLPFFGVTLVVAVLASVALGGFNLSAEALTPKLDKLDPVKGMKRVFSMRGLMELLKSMAKFVLIAGTTTLLLWWWAPDLLYLGSMDVGVGIVESAKLIGWGGIIVASTLVLVAAVDVPFQLWDHKRQLKMTQQEVREELKETEGRPEVRGRIRQLQREMAQRRMMEEVPKADVIVTNPTHYAVALRYDAERMRAPIVVAKGTELVAANIRRIGAAHAVPVIEAPLLARAIYFNTELDEAIPAALYVAVAQLLAYVFQLHAFEEAGGDIPQPPSEFPIPDELRTEEHPR
ncbi:MAG: flagellar biosynthesis protein FlhB [Gammaproteobacteria bacterium]|jgi:flagellar biosynthetic protein FlhB